MTNDIDAIRPLVERYPTATNRYQLDLALRIAEASPDLLAKVDELTAEREHMELNPTGTAEWLKNRVKELTAALERALDAKYAALGEIGKLRAELAHVGDQLTAANRRADGAENDQRTLIADKTALANERDALTAELELTRDQRDAARAMADELRDDLRAADDNNAYLQQHIADIRTGAF